MPKIKLLSPNVIAKTAAGEVVERPASVVKELIENALDADASQLKIEITDSGFTKIKLTDNGCGMDKADILECFKHHTTSKLFSEEDLLAIKQFGFRGEALSSIASVSRLTIMSRTAKDAVGNSVELEGGELKRVSSVGMPKGTIVEVSDLFFNTPARKKFLKTAQTEFRAITDCVVTYGLAFTNVGICLIHNKKLLLDLPCNQTLHERASTILGKSMFTHMLDFSHEDNFFKLNGFISRPQISSTTKNNQYIFVNNRCVSNDTLSLAVRDAFGSLLEPRSHPAVILFFNLPYDLVDVNVHPRKEQISFYNESAVYDFVRKATQLALEAHDLTYSTDIFGNDLLNKKALPYLFNSLKDSVEPWNVYTTEKDFADVLQLDTLYLVTQTAKGLLIVDQHAAHERILYEQFLAAFEERANLGESVQLKKPLIVDLSLQDSDLLKENLITLIKLGFELEEFGVNTFKLYTLPKVLSGSDILSLLHNVLTDLKQGKAPSNITEKSLKTVSYLACRSATKGGEYLSLKERTELLKKLYETKSNYTCPHGRPVRIEISLRELAQMFKRSK